MDVPPSPNHEPDFPADDPSTSDESDVESEEDPQEEPEEEEQEEEEEEPKEAQQDQQMDWEEDEDEEPEEAPVMGFDMGMNWEDVDDEEPELIFPYQAEGSPYPPPPVSPDTEPIVDIVRFQSLSATQEIARVGNIRLRRELEEAQISNTLMSMGRDRAERESCFIWGPSLMGIMRRRL
ncbi:hypothetical protein Tco_1319853 [Tanacetum coccineum]